MSISGLGLARLDQVFCFHRVLLLPVFFYHAVYILQGLSAC